MLKMNGPIIRIDGTRSITLDWQESNRGKLLKARLICIERGHIFMGGFESTEGWIGENDVYPIGCGVADIAPDTTLRQPFDAVSSYAREEKFALARLRSGELAAIAVFYAEGRCFMRCRLLIKKR
jgi:hypothetical protein